eukprot:8738644-Pyramimonas_sp.AAC.1
MNCHMPNTSDVTPLHRRILGDICRALPPEEGRMGDDGHTWHSGDRLHHDAFNSACSSWIEFVQDEPTRQ